MKLQIFTVDAFAEVPFGGNPAAVVPHTQDLEDDILQKLASEMNLSETAYVSPVKGAEIAGGEDAWAENGERFSLRWFTPTNEVALCGHATLATAHVLFHHLGNKNKQIQFETMSGVLLARKSGENIVLDFPANPPEELHPTLKADLANLVKALVGDMVLKELRISHKTKKLLLRLDDSYTRQDLESLCPDTGVLLSLHDGSVIKGVIVSLRGLLSLKEEKEEEEKKNVGKLQTEKQYHILSRYFAPWNGIPEDPVTGRQCSPRGGDIDVNIRDDGRVDLAGKATTVIQGQISI